MDESERPRRRFLRSRGRRIGVAVGAIAVAAFGVLWVQRVPIATDFIDRELVRDGVAARYHITDLGVGRQRLTNVVIGDPANPDLVADWVETYTAIGLTGPYVAGVRAGHVRVRARLADGKISLGAIDRLLPAASNQQGFSLPAIDLGVEDARVRLETPYGVVGLKIAGDGRLDNGFHGTIAALSEEIAAGGCTLTRPNAVLKVTIGRDGPHVSGPVGIPEAQCGGVTLAGARIGVSATIGTALDHWSGNVGLRADRLTGAGARAAAIGGTISFAGNARRTEGSADLGSGPFALAAALGERLGVTGKWQVIDGRPTLAGDVRARGVALDDTTRRAIARAGGTGAGTPIAPLAQQLMAAAGGAARRFDITGNVGLARDGIFTLSGLSADAASGARLALDDGSVTFGQAAGWRVNGAASLSGGGFPATRITMRQPTVEGALTGTASIAPYAAGGAQLALAPISFASDARGRVTIRTAAALSGPLGDGRVENLRLPLVATVAGSAVTLNPMCTPLAFDRLAAGGVVLRPARLTLCPTGAALFDTRSGYGARIAATRLEGTIGSSPLTLAATGGEVRAGGFTLAGVETRIGPADRRTALDFARIDGAFGAKGLAGTFSGGAGQIANVPLLLSKADGRWTFARGALDLTGELGVADAAADPRFLPLAARNVALRLADGVITTTGELRAPAKNVKVADVTIRHTLASGTGNARLVVPGITFDKGFQPDELTKLTFGVIADVQGKITGEGDIAWNAAGVTSSGTFRTAGTDLAAAFGPVTGVKGEIRFTDLLALESAPGQVATVASINPGVPVTDGRVVYQTLANSRVKVEAARWPFAGGELTLDPALLDFSSHEARRLVFRVNGAEAAQFLQQFDFKNLNATGVFDGALPIAFDESGGRVENGHLIVRPGGGGIAYVGELTAKDLGTWGNIAFQALKSLRYQSLDIVMNGPLAGEMVTEVRFAGVSQGAGAKSNFLIRRLQKLPFVFNVRIKAPFRGLLDSVASFYDPKRLIERNLPALLEEQERQQQQKAKPPAAPVQPPASEKMP